MALGCRVTTRLNFVTISNNGPSRRLSSFKILPQCEVPSIKLSQQPETRRSLSGLSQAANSTLRNSGHLVRLVLWQVRPVTTSTLCRQCSKAKKKDDTSSSSSESDDEEDKLKKKSNMGDAEATKKTTEEKFKGSNESVEAGSKSKAEQEPLGLQAVVNDEILAYLQQPRQIRFGLIKIIITMVLGIYFGAFMAKFSANLLEEYEIFVRGDDDDD
ncbi:hypothetical protein HDE_07032 [Halotydeus destructor]|nr:hypothetical protein HDE_07032 [Halotydeus destructor]